VWQRNKGVKQAVLNAYLKKLPAKKSKHLLVEVNCKSKNLAVPQLFLNSYLSSTCRSYDIRITSDVFTPSLYNDTSLLSVLVLPGVNHVIEDLVKSSRRTCEAVHFILYLGRESRGET
jgi:hypothetical protein